MFEKYKEKENATLKETKLVCLTVEIRQLAARQMIGAQITMKRTNNLQD